jgi:hypothetical protein
MRPDKDKFRRWAEKGILKYKKYLVDNAYRRGRKLKLPDGKKIDMPSVSETAVRAALIMTFKKGGGRRRRQVQQRPPEETAFRVLP